MLLGRNKYGEIIVPPLLRPELVVCRLTLHGQDNAHNELLPALPSRKSFDMSESTLLCSYSFQLPQQAICQIM